MKRLAIMFYGHARTYAKTYKNFVKFVKNINKDYEIDIFIHTWDEFSTSFGSVNQGRNYYPTLSGKKLENKDILDIKNKYNPVKMEVSTLSPNTHGLKVSYEKVRTLRLAYEKEKQISYDFILTTRLDILFLRPLNIDFYINLYKNHRELSKVPLPKNFVFCSTQPFRLRVMDSRYANEGDLVFFSNADLSELITFDFFTIFLRYRIGIEFIPLRERGNLRVKYRAKFMAFLRNFRDSFRKEKLKKHLAHKA